MNFRPLAYGCVDSDADYISVMWLMLGCAVLLAAISGVVHCLRLSAHAAASSDTRRNRSVALNQPDVDDPVAQANGAAATDAERQSNSSQADDEPSRVQQVLFIVNYLQNVLYLPLATQLLGMLQCDSTPTGASFLRAAPYLECSGSRFQAARAFAIVGIFIFVVAYPLLVLARIAHHRAELSTCALRHELGFVWCTVRPPACFWEPLVLLPRRLLLAVILTQLPVRSVYVPVLVFAVLAASIYAHVAWMPYVQTANNRLEIALTSLALVTYLSGILLGVGSKLRASNLDVLLRYLTSAVKLLLVLLLLVNFGRRMQNALRLRRQKSDRDAPLLGAS